MEKDDGTLRTEPSKAAAVTVRNREVEQGEQGGPGPLELLEQQKQTHYQTYNNFCNSLGMLEGHLVS